MSTTHEDLDALLGALGADAPGVDDADALAQLERLADAAPADAHVRAALLAVHGRDTAGAGLPPVVGEVRRELLVRWDAMSTTWLGTDLHSGRPAMVRVLRPHAARDPVLRRQLARDHEALRDVMPIRAEEAPVPALVAVLAGPTVSLAQGGRAGPDALVRLFVRSLLLLRAWETVGPGLPVPVEHELRDAGDALVVQTLTPQAAPARDGLRRVAGAVLGWWQDAADHPVAELLVGLVDHPPAALDDALAPTRRALATALAEIRHDLVRRRAATQAARAHDQLERVLARLEAASPPPVGRGALGVDLDGQTQVVASDGERVTWGPGDDAEAVVFDPDDDLDVQLARRLVRARGEAPISAGLNAEVGGDPVFVGRIARWVAAMLELRTVRLLLAATRA